MKKIIIPTLIMAALSFASCKKERTCSCTETRTTTNRTVPQNGSAATETSNSSVNKSEQTMSKVKKSEMHRLLDCNSTSETNVDTRTTTVFVGSPIPTQVQADVTSTTVTDKTCEIK